VSAGLATREARASEHDLVETAAELVRGRLGGRREAALILGTGLGALGERAHVEAAIEGSALSGGAPVGLSIITDRCLPDALGPAPTKRIIVVARGAEPAPADTVRGVLERL
jgi:purine-nucleoside phosphorylase